MNILGINAYHGDASAVLVQDGRLVAAVEEERFNRLKHWAGFPAEAIRYCLREGGIGVGDLDHVAVGRDPKAHLHKKILFALSRGPSLGLVKDRLANAARVGDMKAALAAALGVEGKGIRAKFHKVEHHRAHMASAFLVSPFEEAALLSIDGFGDFVSAMWGRGRGNRIESDGYVPFPHSLGILYTAVTQYIGFPKYGDEYKVMGLAPYGKPTYLEEFRKIVRGSPDGYDLDLDFFLHHSDGVPMVWDGGEPTIGRVYSEKFVERFGPARAKGEPLEKRHEDLAASVQAVCEETIFGLLRGLHERTGLDRLCLAGGVGFNSVANGKILDETPFTDLYIQPAAGDAGTALGAAFYVWNHVLGNPRTFVMEHAYWGPGAGDGAIDGAFAARKADLEAAGVSLRSFADEGDLCRETARAVAAGKVVGWFQGRMEWGPRALGNRSILADPRRTDMRDRINEIIKKRENFRPFCPSILEEAVPEYFERDHPEPFMIRVYPVRKEKQGVIPAVTHVDGTGRLQSVSDRQNPLYAKLLRAFRDETGVPVLLNTSFNENEPIVTRPEEALDCFLRTRMDVLVMGKRMATRKG